MTMKKIAKNIKFEEALAELEQQVQLLESGELPLEEALAAFQQGVALSKVCMTKLNTVQQEVEKSSLLLTTITNMNWKHSQSWRIDMDFNKYYEDRQKLVNTFLEKRLEKKGISRVDEAMAYSLLAGGKRIRPIILMQQPMLWVSAVIIFCR